MAGIKFFKNHSPPIWCRVDGAVVVVGCCGVRLADRGRPSPVNVKVAGAGGGRLAGWGRPCDKRSVGGQGGCGRSPFFCVLIAHDVY